MKIGIKNAAVAENDQDVTVVGVQGVQIATEIRNADYLKKIALRGTNIGNVEATVEKARERDFKEGRRLAILYKTWPGKWVETGRESLVGVMVGNVRVDEKVMMLDGRVTEETGDQNGAQVVGTGMAGQMFEVMSVETAAEGKMEGESDAAVKK